MNDEHRRNCPLRLLIGTVLTIFCVTAVAAGPGKIELGFLNGDYQELDQRLKPVQQGPLTITLTSPDHRLKVHRNELVFKPRADGVIDARVEVDFEGDGDLVADLEGVGVATRFNDKVAVRRQLMVVEGTARLERIEGGYQVTLVEKPTASPVEIESRMMSQIVDLCSGLDSLPLLALDCPALDRSLTHLAPPLPEPGEQFFLSSDRLSAKERKFFDRYARKAR